MLIAPGLCAQPAGTQPTERESQRTIYLLAQEAQQQSRTDEYEQLLVQLGDYPLRSYLEYNALRPRLAGLARTGGDTSEVDRFLSSYPETTLAARLERTWVDLLARQQRWAEVMRYHNPANTTTELTCHALHAQLLAGDNAALLQIAPLWNVARSQPNACDPVFEKWIDENMLTPEIAWQRFSKAIRAGQNSLAGYIARLLPDRERALATLYQEVDRDPALLRNQSTFSEQSPEVREMLLYGLQQLAVSNGNLAMTLLGEYDTRHAFAAEEKLALQRYIAQRLLLQGYVSETESLLRESPELASESLVSWLLRDSLKRQEWSHISALLDLLPPDAHSSERWQYWRARALVESGTSAALEEAEIIRRALARTRSFYGFMAADQLGSSYEFADLPVNVDQAQIDALYEIPAIDRAHELYLVGDEPNARNEWQYATGNMTDEQIIASGKLVDSWGWHRIGIQAMIRVSYWDDLQLRFPLAYADVFNSSANELSLAPQLLFAVARQESAFMHDVRSPAGALGLMQLIPATARETAGRSGLRISNQDLLTPEINIVLGSRYLSQMLKDFSGNRALAAAAYNAGPNRVRQWLRQQNAVPVPLDIWIETIPFAETRDYVQNILTYAVIYGYRMGEPVSMLTDGEAAATF